MCEVVTIYFIDKDDVTSRHLANKLTIRACETLKCSPNKHMVNHYDGGGLYFRVTPNKKSWLFQFTLNGKRNLISIGSYDIYSLADARKKRDILKEQVFNGIDPRIEKQKYDSRRRGFD